MFNTSLKCAVFSFHWKTSVKIPLHKTCLIDDHSNRCYISRTLVASGVVERVIERQILKFLPSQSLIHTDHHGFLKSYSATICDHGLQTSLLWQSMPVITYSCFSPYGQAYGCVCHSVPLINLIIVAP